MIGKVIACAQLPISMPVATTFALPCLAEMLKYMFGGLGGGKD